MRSSPRTVRRKRVLIALAGIAVGLPSGVLQQWAFESRTLDAFHLGELFATNTYLMGGSPAGPPLTVHGAVDYVPAALAHVVFGDDASTYATILLLALCVVAAQVLFVLLVERLLQAQRAMLPFMFSVGLVASQTVHYRDLGLIVSLSVYYWMLGTAPGRRRDLLILLTGVVTYLAFLWTWNRGLPLLLGMAMALVVLSVPRGQRNHLLGLASMAVIAVALSALSPLFTPSTIVEDLALLLEASEGTRYAWDFGQAQAFLGYAVLYAVTFAALLMFGLRRPRSSSRLAQTALWAVLLAASIKVALDRFDWLHVMPSMWIVLAIMILSAPALASAIPRQWLLVGSGLLIGLLWLTVGTADSPVTQWVALLLASVAVAGPLAEMTVVWALLALMVVTVQLQASRDSMPVWAPSDLVQRFAVGPQLSDGQQWLVDQVREQPCLVDVTNRGLVNHLSAVPSCFRYGALLWVPNTKQSELIQDVRAQDPDVVAWTSEPSPRPAFGGMDRLVQWLETEYPVLRCFGGECVRSR